MEITRKQIEKEKDYRKLQGIGRSFKANGHKLVLNAKEPELKKRLLYIFDEHYAVPVEPEPEPMAEDVTEVVEEAIAEAEPEPEPKIETPKGQLYIAPRYYRDWASGWSFTPGMDEPKPLPDKLTPGLENALKTKKIILYEG